MDIIYEKIRFTDAEKTILSESRLPKELKRAYLEVIENQEITCYQGEPESRVDKLMGQLSYDGNIDIIYRNTQDEIKQETYIIAKTESANKILIMTEFKDSHTELTLGITTEPTSEKDKSYTILKSPEEYRIRTTSSSDKNISEDTIKKLEIYKKI